MSNIGYSIMNATREQELDARDINQRCLAELKGEGEEGYAMAYGVRTGTGQINLFDSGALIYDEEDYSDFQSEYAGSDILAAFTSRAYINLTEAWEKTVRAGKSPYEIEDAAVEEEKIMQSFSGAVLRTAKNEGEEFYAAAYGIETEAERVNMFEYCPLFRSQKQLNEFAKAYAPGEVLAVSLDKEDDCVVYSFLHKWQEAEET